MQRPPPDNKHLRDRARGRFCDMKVVPKSEDRIDVKLPISGKIAEPGRSPEVRRSNQGDGSRREWVRRGIGAAKTKVFRHRHSKAVQSFRLRLEQLSDQKDGSRAINVANIAPWSSCRHAVQSSSCSICADVVQAGHLHRHFAAARSVRRARRSTERARGRRWRGEAECACPDIGTRCSSVDP